MKMPLFTRKLMLLTFLAIGMLILSCGNDATDPYGDVGNNDFVASEPFSLQFDVTNQTGIRADAINAAFEVVGVEGLNTISITGEKHVGSSSMEDAEEHLQFLIVSAVDHGHEILIETEQPEYAGGRNYSFDFLIEIPVDFDVAIAVANGTAYIEFIEGDFSFDAANGTVVFNQTSGNISVTMANGTISGNFQVPLNGSVTAFLGNGTMALDIPQNTSADFSAQVTNGSVSVSNLTLYDEVVTPNSVTGILGSGEGTIDLSAANGGIVVTGY
jgi:hypothetical protein